MKLLIATRSEGKLQEIQRVLGELPAELLSLAEAGVPESPDEDELETEDDFAANALAKARHFHALTGLPTLADDSGLAVDALGGAPGVMSKRYAPEAWRAKHGVDRANNLYLLHSMETIRDAERTAHFHCSLAFVEDEIERVFDGRVDGVILREPRGSGGFGYDPLFLLPERGVTTAELAADEKDEASHRGRAARKARAWLMEWLGPETSSETDQ